MGWALDRSVREATALTNVELASVMGVSVEELDEIVERLLEWGFVERLEGTPPRFMLTLEGHGIAPQVLGEDPPV